MTRNPMAAAATASSALVLLTLVSPVAAAGGIEDVVEDCEDVHCDEILSAEDCGGAKCDALLYLFQVHTEGFPGGKPPPQSVNYEETVARYFGGGGAVTVCYPGMIVCAMAGADSHVEDIGSAPDVAVMMTMGGGQSGSAWGGQAHVRSTIGEDTCEFDAWSGCLLSWSDVRHSNNCYPTETETLAVSDFLSVSIPAQYRDAVCEKR